MLDYILFPSISQPNNTHNGTTMYEQFLPIISICIYLFVLVKALFMTRVVKGNGLGIEEAIIAGITIVTLLSLGIMVHDFLIHLDYKQEYFYYLIFGRHLIAATVYYSAMKYIDKIYPFRLTNKNNGE